MHANRRAWYRIGILALVGSGLIACDKDELEPSPPTTFGVWNLLDYNITVDWNADPQSATQLAPQYFTTVRTIRNYGGSAPGIEETPLWCLRVRLGAGGSTIFYGTDIPLNNYVRHDQATGGKLFLLVIDEAFLDLPQSPTHCMSPTAE